MQQVTGTAIPMIVIATIEKNEKEENVRAKYRICALGNLDLYSWTKMECFAPVMSQLEMRIILPLAVHHRTKIK
eukprot:4410548-Ditylum_brightwellii.AAC.1